MSLTFAAMLKDVRKALILVLLMVTSLGYAQERGGRMPGKPANGEIFGSLMDSNNGDPMEFAAVTLFDKNTDELITGVMTNHAGRFSLTELSMGEYRLEISFVGYELKVINDIALTEKQNVINLGEVELESNNTLEEVVLDGSRPVINYEIDRKVVDVSKLQVDMGQTATEILENVPSITVANDGTVSLRGSSSFTLFIDGRPTAMDASEALAIIPASTIKEIEIITNPSAKYEAEGTSGIMNIITKSNKLEGVSMLLNAGVGNYENYNSDVSVNIREDKIEANIGFNMRNRTRPDTRTNERISRFDSLTSVVSSEGEGDWQMGGYGFNGELSFFPNSAHTLTVGGRYNVRLMNGFSDLYFSEYNNDVNVLNYLNKEFSERQFNATSAYFTYKYNVNRKKDHYIELRSTYNTRVGDEIVQADYIDADGVKQGGTRNTEKGPSRKFRVNLDYSNKLASGLTIEAGTQIQFGYSADEGRNYDYDPVTGDYILQPLFSSDATYERDIYGVYGLVKGSEGKFGYQVGLRGEYTDRTIEAVNFESITEINRMDWFPTLHFSYDIKEDQQVLINYTRRIQRPRSWYLEPFITWQNAYTVYRGNPDLFPEYIDAVEINWIKTLPAQKGFISVESYFRHVDNYISRIQVPYDTNQIMNTPVNVGQTYTLGLEPSLNYNFKKWWKIDLAFNLYSYTIQSQHEQLMSSHNFNWNSRLTNTFPLENNWNIQITTRYISPTNTVQGTAKGYFTANGSVKKSFSKNRYSLVLQVRDMFNTIRRENYALAGNVETYNLSIPKTPMVMLTFSMRLNNYNKRQRSQEEGDEF